MTTAAFQGELGAYSEAAVHLFFDGAVEPVPRREFAEVGQAVADGAAEYGVLPIENTLAGSVVGSYDVLATHELTVVGEVITPIHHCVLGTPGATLDGLTRVLSHPVALAQCTRFLQARRGLEAVAVYDTAGAAREVADRADAALGAIAGRHAAARYGLKILATDVEDRHDNQTRFLVVSRAGAPLPPPATARRDRSPAMRTSLILETKNTPGALVRVLLPFSARSINLSKLESRPAGEPWTYRFFVELEVDAASRVAREALEEVQQHAATLRVLGSYPRWLT
jgi:prephenate dehydratase